MSRDAIYDHLASITGEQNPVLPESRLLLRLHATIVQLHASLADAASIDRAAHLVVLRDLKEMADDIERSELFRMAEQSPLADLEITEIVARDAASTTLG